MYGAGLAQYAQLSPVVTDPIRNGMVRTANWLGFHAALLVGTALWWLKGGSHRWKLVVWLAIGYAGVVRRGGASSRATYLLILPPQLVTLGAAGLASIRSRALIALVAVALAVPLIRFAPRYISLSNWSDLALDKDSRAAAGLIHARAAAGSTLYVWGYRPELFVYTGLRPAARYLDSQTMTGVPADRHLTQSIAVLTRGTHEAREELARSRPDFIADGLSLYNPSRSRWIVTPNCGPGWPITGKWLAQRVRSYMPVTLGECEFL